MPLTSLTPELVRYCFDLARTEDEERWAKDFGARRLCPMTQVSRSLRRMYNRTWSPHHAIATLCVPVIFGNAPTFTTVEDWKRYLQAAMSLTSRWTACPWPIRLVSSMDPAPHLAYLGLSSSEGEGGGTCIDAFLSCIMALYTMGLRERVGFIEIALGPSVVTTSQETKRNMVFSFSLLKHVQAVRFRLDMPPNYGNQLGVDAEHHMVTVLSSAVRFLRPALKTVFFRMDEPTANMDTVVLKHLLNFTFFVMSMDVNLRYYVISHAAEWTATPREPTRSYSEYGTLDRIVLENYGTWSLEDDGAVRLLEQLDLARLEFAGTRVFAPRLGGILDNFPHHPDRAPMTLAMTTPCAARRLPAWLTVEAAKK